MPTDALSGDSLLPLLGLNADNAEIRHLLDAVAHRMEPELDPEDPESLFDWICINEIGLELGFGDDAYIRALDEDRRHTAPPVLFQLYFYGDTAKTKPFPFPLPLGLSFDDNSAVVRQKLSKFEHTRRSYIRDAWRLPEFDVTVAYHQQTNRLESVYCHLPFAPWPPRADDVRLVESVAELTSLFGRRWSDPELMLRFPQLNLQSKIAEIRSQHEADFRKTYGLELMFTDAERMKSGTAPALVFGAVTFYASRELDARQWDGPLPFGLSFSDSQRTAFEKVGRG